MSMELITTAEADRDLMLIEDYLLRNWSYAVLVDFYRKYDRACEMICDGSVKFMQYEDTEYRKFLLTDHNSIIYKIAGNQVIIMRILQNFKNPDDNYQSLIQEK